MLKRIAQGKALLLLVISVTMLFVVSACKNIETDTSAPSTNTPSQVKEYSLEERKELAEDAFLSDLYDDLFVFNTGMFAQIYYPNTKYTASVKQVSERKYEVTCVLYYYDKYENLVGIADDVHGDVEMEPDGTVISVHAYNFLSVDWE